MTMSLQRWSWNRYTSISKVLWCAPLHFLGVDWESIAHSNLCTRAANFELLYNRKRQWTHFYKPFNVRENKMMVLWILSYYILGKRQWTHFYGPFNIHESKMMVLGSGLAAFMSWCTYKRMRDCKCKKWAEAPHLEKIIKPRNERKATATTYIYSPNWLWASMISDLNLSSCRGLILVDYILDHNISLLNHWTQTSSLTSLVLLSLLSAEKELLWFEKSDRLLLWTNVHGNKMVVWGSITIIHTCISNLANMHSAVIWILLQSDWLHMHTHTSCKKI